MQKSISYAKLNDGGWGVRYAARGPHPAPGDTVTVRKADGSLNDVVLGGWVMHDAGAFPGPATYFRIARRNGNGRRRSAPRRNTRPAPRPVADNGREAFIEAGRALSEQIVKAHALHEAYDEDGYDGETEIRDAAIERIRVMEATLDTLRAEYRTRYLVSA